MDSSDAATHVNWQSGSWTNVMPPTYGYEVIQPPSLSQPAETFLAPAAAAAQHEIRLLESQPHVVAVRPHRGGEMTNRSSHERRNMIQSIHISRPRTSQRRSHIRLPPSPSPPTAGPSNDPPALIPPAQPLFSELAATEPPAAPSPLACTTARVYGISTKQIAISRLLVKYMATIRQSFRDEASHVVERQFGIRTWVEHTNDQTEERRTRVAALLAMPNFGFLHVLTNDMYGDAEMIHFAHPCIADIITNVVWRGYGSGSFAAVASFTPIMAVVVTAIVVALRELRTGQYRRSALQGDNFLEIYEQATAFIRSIETKPLMILYNNALIPLVEDEDEDSGDMSE
ncbi:hypothetical protein V8E55_004512 [Tylopilus felleus]